MNPGTIGDSVVIISSSTTQLSPLLFGMRSHVPALGHGTNNRARYNFSRNERCDQLCAGLGSNSRQPLQATTLRCWKASATMT
jgi:hypothetical protein